MNTKSTIITTMLMVILFAATSFGQIFEPEGLNMPGAFNGWINPPAKAAFAGTQGSGTLLPNTSLPTRRYRTLIYIDASGADTSAGTYSWLFTSGPSGNYYANKWAGRNVTLNTLESYTFNSGADNSVTLANGKYYTVNWRDAGYTNTDAIWMETSAPPVTIPTVTQSPLPGSVDVGENVTVTVTLSATKSAEEFVYVRYTTDGWSTDSLVEVGNYTGATGTATIPSQAGGTSVSYYVFSTTVSMPSSDYDMYTINHNNNGGSNYSYSVNAAQYTITASNGPNGLITPSGAVLVTHGNNQQFTITANVGYFIDSVLVDGILVDSTGSYTFVNVTSNHTIYASFIQKKNVTFQVNMKVQMQEGHFRPDSGDHVLIRGGFNGFNQQDTLTDGDNDSIYTKTLLLEAPGYHEYKYWKTFRDGVDWETFGGNRNFTLGDNDTTLPVVYFSNAGPTVQVTFQVNMSVKQLLGTFRPDLGDIVLVRGNWNGFGTTDTLKDLDNDSIYTGTFGMAGEQTIDYKFWKTDRGGLAWEDNISNRTYGLGASNVTIPVVYFDDDNQSPTAIMSVKNKWNLLSIPREPVDPRKTTLFSNASSNAFAFDNGYVVEDSLQKGIGYWLKFPADEDVAITGLSFSSITIPVNPGWNMVGTTSGEALVSLIGYSGTTRVSAFFGYQAGYVTYDTLQPGRAYFVKFDSAGSITINASAMAPGAAGKFTGSPVGDAQEIRIIDAVGNSQSLYIGVANRSGLSWEMPPTPPAGVFDVRFATGTMAEFVQSGKQYEIPIRSTSVSYPMTIRWEGSAQLSGASIRVNERSYDLAAKGSVTLNDENDEAVVFVTGVKEVPSVYSLSQNYPNPFNPTTSIKYGLPADSRVTIEVFNILGQKLDVLLDETMEAGFHELRWDASAKPSGVYFYRINATSVNDGKNTFNETRKMVLMR